jgi:glycine/D-amino acid oxidase-like deaminating enzyme
MTPRQLISRREWLSRFAAPTVGALSALGAAACARDRQAYVVERTAGRGRRRRFVPVAAERERVIRSSVGLRPYRTGGFRLESQNLEGRQLIHLYGHGGGGMTLSWGSANLAVEQLARQGAPNAVAVVGAGVIGLTTAILLQRQGFGVTVYAERAYPHTTSNASAATFYPSHVIDPERVTAEFSGRLESALRTSYHAFQRLVGDRYGVRWLDSYYLTTGAPSAGPPSAETVAQDHVVGDVVAPVADGAHPFQSPRVLQGRDLIIEPPIYLRALLDDFRAAGGALVIRRFASLNDVAKVPERAVFNCTGLGARTLVGDTEVRPARGQLLVLEPQPDVDYSLYHGDFYYMVPRKDGVVLGGTFELDAESTAPDPATERRLLEAHARVFDAMR